MATDQQRSIVNNLQNDPKVAHPRAGEAKRVFLEKQCREDAIRGLIIAVGKDKWLSAVASVVGEERALASAAQYGIATQSFRDGREALVTRLTQSSVQIGPDPDKPPRQAADRKQSRVGLDYLDYTEVMTLVAAGLPWQSEKVQAACRLVDEKYGYEPPASEFGTPDILPQRSYASTNPAALLNAERDDDDLTATVAEQPRRVRVSVPPPIGMEQA